MILNLKPRVYLIASFLMLFCALIGSALWLFPELEQYMFFLGDDHVVVPMTPVTYTLFLLFNEMYEMTKKIDELQFYKNRMESHRDTYQD